VTDAEVKEWWRNDWAMVTQIGSLDKVIKLQEKYGRI
jgi:hypothetical protein